MASLRPSSRHLLRLLASGRPHTIPAASSFHSFPTVSGSNSTVFHPPSTAALSPSLSSNRIASLRHVTTNNAGSGSEGRQPSAEAKARGRRMQVITGSLTALFGALYILYRQLHAKEEEGAGQEAWKEERKKKEKVHRCRGGGGGAGGGAEGDPEQSTSIFDSITLSSN